MPTELPKPASFIKIDEIDEALDEFERQLAGMPKWEKEDAPEYLTIPLSELRKKTPEELAEAEFELNRYALSLDRLIGRHKAWERWARSKLNQVSAEYLPDISTKYGFNERMHMAKNTPEACSKLNEFLRDLDMKLSRLESIPDNIRRICDSIKSLRFIAISREKQYVSE